MNIAIITARGGSVRLPRKNVRPFCGHPLIAWSITAALNSQTVDSVVVSTDDDEIQDISLQYGASVIRRPDWPNPNELAANVPIGHAVDELYKVHGNAFTELVTILPTVPLIKPEDIDNLVRKRRELGADRLSPIIPQRETCLYKLITKNHARLAIFDKKYNYGIQPGGIVSTTPKCYIAFNDELPSKLDKVLDLPENWSSIEYYWVPAEYWQYADVDTAEEFEFAELVMEHYILKGQGMKVYTDYRASWEKALETIKESIDPEEVAKAVLAKYGNSEQR